MKKHLLALLLLLSPARAADEAPFHNPVDNPALPRVLLIGDSISIGYTDAVRESLRDAANVHRIPENGRHTAYGLDKIDGWLGTNRWDVIHFNWGLWDTVHWEPGSGIPGKKNKETGVICATPEAYEANLEKLVQRMKRTGARLIWASTTPIPEGEPGRKAGDEARYNARAAEIMRRHGVEINDLHARAAEKLPAIAIRPGDVHYTAEGSRWLAGQVAARIRAALPGR